MEIQPVLDAYLKELAKYIPYISNGLEVYKELKSLNVEDFTDDNSRMGGNDWILETISIIIQKITG